MSPKGHPKRQHYVPRLLLRGFANAKEQVFAFDKLESRVFHTSIDNIASQKGFYDLDVPDGIVTLEPGLAALETAVAPIIDSIRSSKSLGHLSDEQRVQLAHFAMVQHLRTWNHRENMGQMNADMATWLRKFTPDPNSIEGFKEFDEDDLRRFTLESVAQAHEFVPHLLDKATILQGRTARKGYYIGDNPLALHNRKQFGFYGNIGLAVPGIEIYLPLSSEMTIAWLSHTHIDEFNEFLERARLLRLKRPLESGRIWDSTAHARAFLEGCTSGRLVQCVDDNVTYINSLQVKAAERYVFCEADDFELVRTMIADNPKTRLGPRGKVG